MNEISKYMAKIGRKGGKAKGAAKRRSPEHYERLASMKRRLFTICPKCWEVDDHAATCPDRPS